jgi:hypothetical protein
VTPFVITGGRVYIPRPNETRPALIARACLDTINPDRDNTKRGAA